MPSVNFSFSSGIQRVAEKAASAIRHRQSAAERAASFPRRGLQTQETRVDSAPRYRQSAATRTSYFPRRGLQREENNSNSKARHFQDAAVNVEHLINQVSAVATHVSRSVLPYSSEVQEENYSSNIGKNMRRPFYGVSHGPKRQHVGRLVRPQCDRIVYSYGGRRVSNWGPRLGYGSGDRKVLSYGDRRVFSYGERHSFSYGDRFRSRRALGRERQHHLGSSGRGDNGESFKRWFRESDIELLTSGLGALSVAGQFLTTFRRNLKFNNLPAILKVKYQLAGNDYKSLPQAQAVWESIPTQVRAGGPEALWKFHKGKDWSHIIAKSKGGQSTADNAIWWSSEKNRSLGSNPMSLADIADARAVMRSNAIRVSIAQTAGSMVQGALVAVVVSGALACIECGLNYAEGKITWREMVQEVVGTGVKAGGGAFVTTGIIVGISLLFPFLIPMLMPVLFVLQVASLAFMGAKGFKLAKGWWAVLERQQPQVHSAYGETFRTIRRAVRTLPSMSRRKSNRTGSSLKNAAQALSGWKTARMFP